jgi:hypothetical protein
MCTRTCTNTRALDNSNADRGTDSCVPVFSFVCGYGFANVVTANRPQDHYHANRPQDHYHANRQTDHYHANRPQDHYHTNRPQDHYHANRQTDKLANRQTHKPSNATPKVDCHHKSQAPLLHTKRSQLHHYIEESESSMHVKWDACANTRKLQRVHHFSTH